MNAFIRLLSRFTGFNSLFGSDRGSVNSSLESVRPAALLEKKDPPRGSSGFHMSPYPEGLLDVLKQAKKPAGSDFKYDIADEAARHYFMNQIFYEVPPYEAVKETFPGLKPIQYIQALRDVAKADEGTAKTRGDVIIGKVGHDFVFVDKFLTNTRISATYTTLTLRFPFTKLGNPDREATALNFCNERVAREYEHLNHSLYEGIGARRVANFKFIEDPRNVVNDNARDRGTILDHAGIIGYRRDDILLLQIIDKNQKENKNGVTVEAGMEGAGRGVDEIGK